MLFKHVGVMNNIHCAADCECNFVCTEAGIKGLKGKKRDAPNITKLGYCPLGFDVLYA